MRVLLARIKKKFLKAFFRVVDAVMATDHYYRYSNLVNGFHDPNYSFSKDQIMFVHLPKTGGTSLAKMLQTDPKKRFANLIIHKPVSLHCPPSDYKYVTVMRDPVSRVWSQYQMILREGKEYPYFRFANQGLETFLTKCWAVQNLTVRYLSATSYATPTTQNLEQAKNNLGYFYDVLEFENFSDEAGRFLSQHKIPFEKMLNERKSSYATPSDAEKQLILHYNQLDLALWEWWKTTAKK